MAISSIVKISCQLVQGTEQLLGFLVPERFPDLNPPLPLKSPLACITFFMVLHLEFLKKKNT